VALTTAETRVFFDDGTRCQRYSLEGANCDFYATPSFLPARTGDFIVYLVKALKPLGIRGVQYQDPGSTTAALARVDLEA